MLRWYGANETGTTVSTGTHPITICFDGIYLWVTDFNAGGVTKINAHDLQVVTNNYVTGNQAPRCRVRRLQCLGHQLPR